MAHSVYWLRTVNILSWILQAHTTADLASLLCRVWWKDPRG